MPPGVIPALEAIVEPDRVALEINFEQANGRRNEKRQCIKRQWLSKECTTTKNVRQNVKAVNICQFLLGGLSILTQPKGHPKIVAL